MRFYWDGEQVVSVWRANPNFVSWIDTLTKWAYIRLNARLVEQRHSVAVVHGEILNPDGECCAECTCTYFVYAGDKAIEMGYMPATLDDAEVTLEDVEVSLSDAVALLGR